MRMCVLVYVHIGAWHRKDVDVSSATDTNLKWDYMGYIYYLPFVVGQKITKTEREVMCWY